MEGIQETEVEGPLDPRPRWGSRGGLCVQLPPEGCWADGGETGGCMPKQIGAPPQWGALRWVRLEVVEQGCERGKLPGISGLLGCRRVFRLDPEREGRGAGRALAAHPFLWARSFSS